MDAIYKPGIRWLDHLFNLTNIIPEHFNGTP